MASFAAREVDLGGAKLVLTGAMPVERGVHKLDFALVAQPQGGAFTPPDISGYRRSSLSSRVVDEKFCSGELAGLVAKGFVPKVLTLEYVNTSLTWNGGENGVWTLGGKNKGWLVTELPGTTDDFYLGDDVLFAPNAAPETITLSGDIEAAEMIVNGDYTVTGGDRLDVGVLDVTGGSVRFAREVNAVRASLTGNAQLTLEQALRVTGAFTQGAGSTLIIDVKKLGRAAALVGDFGGSTATLTIDSAAKLELKGDEVGQTYAIARGFDVKSAWQDENVSGGTDGVYTVAAGAKDVSVTVAAVLVADLSQNHAWVRRKP